MSLQQQLFVEAQCYEFALEFHNLRYFLVFLICRFSSAACIHRLNEWPICCRDPDSVTVAFGI